MASIIQFFFFLFLKFFVSILLLRELLLAFRFGRREVIVSLRKLQKIKYFSVGEMSGSSRAEREGKESEKEV